MKSDRSDHYNCPVLTQRTRVKNEQLTRANVFFFFLFTFQFDRNLLVDGEGRGS